MTGGTRIMTVRGVPVRVHWSVFITVALFSQVLAATALPSGAPGHSAWTYWLVGAVTALALIASVLAHEAGHAWIARRRGVVVRSVTLWALGGVTDVGDTEFPASTEFAVTIAGPVSTLIAAGLTAAIAWVSSMLGLSSLLVVSAGWLAIVNGLLAAFNLLPAAPFDGGRIVHAVVWRRTHSRQRAAEVVARCGRWIGGGLLAAAFFFVSVADIVDALWFGLIGWMVWAPATAAAPAGVPVEALEGADVRDLVVRPVVVVADHLLVPRAVGQVPEGCSIVIARRLDGSCHGVVRRHRLAQASGTGDEDVRVRDLVHECPILPANVSPAQLLASASGRLPVIAVDGAGDPIGVITHGSLHAFVHRQVDPPMIRLDVPVHAGAQNSHR